VNNITKFTVQGNVNESKQFKRKKNNFFNTVTYSDGIKILFFSSISEKWQRYGQIKNKTRRKSINTMTSWTNSKRDLYILNINVSHWEDCSNSGKKQGENNI
jgi:hypothetical protein